MRLAVRIAFVLVAAAALGACGRAKISAEQCRTLIDHAIAVDWQHLPDSIPGEDRRAAADHAKALMTAQLDKCTEAVTPRQYECAMRTETDTTEKLLKCF